MGCSAAAVPEVMVRVTQRDFRFDGIFLGQGQPGVISERAVLFPPKFGMARFRMGRRNNTILQTWA